MKHTSALRCTPARTLIANALLVGALSFGVGCGHAAPAQAPTKTDNPTMMAAPAGAPMMGTPTVVVPAVAAPGATTLAEALAMPPVPDSDGASKEINAFQDADRKMAPPQNAVLFIGSSSIRLWDTLAQDFPEIPVINRGFGGSQLFESVKFADRIAIPYRPKIVALFAGTNDLDYGGKTPGQVFTSFKEFHDKIHAALPDTRLVYLSINPTNSRWKEEGNVLETNYLIQKYILINNAPTDKMTYIDGHNQLLSVDGKPQANLLRDDGLHLNKEGYKVWTAIIRKQLMPLVAEDGVPRLDAPTTK